MLSLQLVSFLCFLHERLLQILGFDHSAMIVSRTWNFKNRKKQLTKLIDEIVIYSYILVWLYTRIVYSYILVYSLYPLDTGRKLNVHKTFRRRLGRLYVQFSPVSKGYSSPRRRTVKRLGGLSVFVHDVIKIYLTNCFVQRFQGEYAIV